jgi:uncharacterized protein (DUF1697 family)
MAINVAFLRGINVGGHNKIKMADLRGMFESMGFKRVQTYIQSGNVLFASEDDTETLRIQIEQEIEKVFSISINVIIRTALELEGIIENCPFSEEKLLEAASSKVETFYVSLLLDSPTQEGIEQLGAFQSERDEFRIQNREVYLLLRDGIRNSRLANNLYKLNVSSTMRNWKTINKINTMAKAIDES